MKMFFAVDCRSRVVNGMTVLEVEADPIDTKALTNIIEHIKIVLKHLPESEVSNAVDELIETNERIFMSKLFVRVDQYEVDNGPLDEIVHAAYDKRFKP